LPSDKADKLSQIVSNQPAALNIHGGARGGPRLGEGLAGCFTYDPPGGVVWTA